MVDWIGVAGVGFNSFCTSMCELVSGICVTPSNTLNYHLTMACHWYATNRIEKVSVLPLSERVLEHYSGIVPEEYLNTGYHDESEAEATTSNWQRKQFKL